MNRILAEFFGFLNEFTACILWASVVIFITLALHKKIGTFNAFLIGAVLGFFASTIICGFLAVIINIRDTLDEVLSELKKLNTRT